jgi:nucleolar protein 14
MAKAKKSNTKKKAGKGKKRAFAVEKPRDLNPFEVHVNKQKFNVLGRKLKNDRGLPGVSRSKALNKVEIH